MTIVAALIVSGVTSAQSWTGQSAGQQGQRPGAGLSISPRSINFGPRTIGVASAPVTFTIKNNGAQSQQIFGANILGPAAAEYALQSAFQPVTLDPGQSVSYDVVFTPTLRGGRYAGFLLDVGAGGLGTPNTRMLMLGQGLGDYGSEILLNCGGPIYVDSEAQQWSKDYGYRSGVSSSTADPIAATDDEALYQDQRYSIDMKYRIPVLDAGAYELTFHFAETVFTGNNQRKFDVLVEDEVVLDNFDIFKTAGHDAAYQVTVIRPVYDGVLDVRLQNVLFEGPPAALAALEVRGIPYLGSTLDAHNFGALASGTTATQPFTFTNLSRDPITVDTISLLFGTSGTSESFSVDIGGSMYSGAMSDVSYPINIPLLPGETFDADVTFAPTIEQYDSIVMQFSGDFLDRNIPLQGLGGHEGDPYLHVVINGPDYVVDYDGDGVERVFMDGSSSHTHEPGHAIISWAWNAEGGPVFSTLPTSSPSTPIGDKTFELTIGDDNDPPRTLTAQHHVSIVEPDNVPGILVRYFDASGGGGASALLDAVPTNPDFAELIDSFHIDGTANVGGSPFTGDVMVQLVADITPPAGNYEFQVSGGVDHRIELDGVPISGPQAISGTVTLEVRYAVDIAPQQPLIVTWSLEGGPFEAIDPAYLTHDETSMIPVINSMPSSGTTQGGNQIVISGLGFFPPDQVTLHWGGQTYGQGFFTNLSASEIQFTSPPGPVGQITVTVETPAGTSNQQLFTYDPDGPVPINFVHEKSVNVEHPTAAVWGMDGRLYVLSLQGRITAVEFDDEWNVINQTVYPGVNGYQANDSLGIAINPYDPPFPVKLYIGHGLHFVNGGSSFSGPSPYTGQVSVVTGPNFDNPVPLITQLPTSNHDHAVNDIEFNNNGDLFVNIGSNTNAGVQHPLSGDLPESPLSAAVLMAPIWQPGFNGDIHYQNTSDQMRNDDQVFGETVDLEPGIDVFTHAFGLRNAYGLLFSTSGRMYAVDNGPNDGFGAASTGPMSQDPDPTEDDELMLIEYGNYYGSPNRGRGRYDPRQYVYRTHDEPSIPGEFTQKIAWLPASSNGLLEYRSDTFQGQMRGDLLVQRWISDIKRVELSADGRFLHDMSTINPWTGALNIVNGPGGVIVALHLDNQQLKILEPDDISAVGLVVQDITPWRAPSTGGTPFIIGGVGFGTTSNTTVTIGGMAATVTTVSSTRITGTIPAMPSPTTELVDIVVQVGSTFDIHENSFRYLMPLPGQEPGRWEDLANVPASLGEVAAGEINGKLYVMGEGNAGTFKYNLITRQWGSNAAMRPLVGHHHAAEVIDDKLYLIGGLGGGSEGKVQIFDPDTNSWSFGADMNWAGGSVSTAVIDGKIYAAGGIVSTFTVNNTAVYDPVLDTWTSLQVMPEGRNHTAAATDGEKLYVFGGRMGGNFVTNGFDTVMIYDPGTDSWESSDDGGSILAPLPQARGGMGKAVYYRGEFYVFGGETLDGDGANMDGVYDRVDVYDPVANTWRLDAPMPTPRHGIFPVLFQSNMFLPGGGTQAAFSLSNEFDVFTRQH